MVLWSRHATGSSWVRDEATAARDLDKLVPLTIDGFPPPLGFRQFHTINVAKWLNAPTSPLPNALLHALEERGKAGRPSAPPPLAPQRIAFCRTPDGVTLAYSRIGEGPPLVKAANWLNHLEHEWDGPMWRHWIAEMANGRSLLRYDERGNGMSDWKIPALNFDQLVDDLQTVADAAKLDRFDLLAISQGCPVAVAFAVRFPERVRRMVLVNGFAAGWAHARDPDFVERWQALSTLARTSWDKPTSAFRQVFTGQFFPDATAEQAQWWNDLQVKSANAENASRFMQLFGQIDVGDLLPQVTVPTLVMHSRDDQLVPFEAGRMMASRIPEAEFVALDSANHLPLENDNAWPTVQRELRRFLRADA